MTTIELRRERIENHKMKTRCFDHVDLRVKDMEVARKFYGKFLPQLGFVRERPEPSPDQEGLGGDFHTFYSAGGDKPSEFFGFTEDKNHQPTARASHSGQIHVKKWIGCRSWCAKRVARRLKGLKSASITVPVTTRFSSRTRTATSWRSAAGKVRSLRNDRVSAKSW